MKQTVANGTRAHHFIVVDPARVTPETDCFNLLSTYSSVPMTYHLPSLFGFGSLERENAAMASVAGIIVLGSAASVHDRQPWQYQLESWLMPFIQQKTPVIGICYGHQMLARMFGGSVAYLTADQHKLRGFYPVDFSASRLWTAGRRSLLRSHCEHVTRCPDDFRVIAGGNDVPIDAMEHRTLPVWGIQTHPEATSEFLKSREIPVPQDLEASLNDGTEIMKRFIAFCQTGQ